MVNRSGWRRCFVAVWIALMLHGCVAVKTQRVADIVVRPLRAAIDIGPLSDDSTMVRDAMESLLELLRTSVMVDTKRFPGVRHPGAAGRCSSPGAWDADSVPGSFARFVGTCKQGVLPPVCRNEKMDGLQRLGNDSGGVLETEFVLPGRLWSRQIVCPPGASGMFDLHGCYVAAPGLMDAVLQESDVLVVLDRSVTDEYDIVPVVGRVYACEVAASDFGGESWIVATPEGALPPELAALHGNSLTRQLTRDGTAASILNVERSLWPLDAEFDADAASERLQLLMVHGPEFLVEVVQLRPGVYVSSSVFPSVVIDTLRHRLQEPPRPDPSVVPPSKNSIVAPKRRRLESSSSSNSTNATVASSSLTCPTGVFLYNYTYTGDNATALRPEGVEVDAVGECVLDCAARGGPGFFGDTSVMECRRVCDAVENGTRLYLQPFFGVGAGLAAEATDDKVAYARSLCVESCPFGSTADGNKGTCDYICSASFSLAVGGVSSEDCTQDCDSARNATTAVEELHASFPLHRACYAVNCTVNGTFEDTAGGECVDECSTGRVANWPERTCDDVCLGGGELLTVAGVDILEEFGDVDAARETCVETCPKGETAHDSEPRCVPVCGPGLVLPPSVTVNASGFLVGGEGNDTCVGSGCCSFDACPAGYEASASRVCERICEGGELYLPSGTVTPNVTYAEAVASKTTAASCVANCSIAAAGYGPDESGIACELLCAVDERMSPSAVEESMESALPNATQLCSELESCPWGQEELTSARVCAFVCPDGAFLSPQGRIDLFPEEECLSVCPRGYTGASASRTCVAACNASTEVVLPDGSDCEEAVCPTGYAPHAESRVCRSICPVGQVLPARGTSASDCRTTCPAGEAVTGTSRVCAVACPTDTYLPPGAASTVDCVYASECPYGTGPDPDTRRCEIACDKGSYLPTGLEDLLQEEPGNLTQANLQCTDSCPTVSLRGSGFGSPSVADEETRSCRLRCTTSSTFLFPFPAPSTTSLQSCYRTCPWGTSGNSQYRVCQPTCDVDTVLDTDGVCRETCIYGVNITDAPLVNIDNLASTRICVLNSTAGPRWTVSGPLEFNVSEIATAGHLVGSDFTSLVEDDDGANDLISFSITAGTGRFLFAIEDASVGAIVVAPNRTLDFETNNVNGVLTYTLTLQATDLNGNTASISAVITVTDANEVPEVSASFEEALLLRGYTLQDNGRFLYGSAGEVVIPAGAMITDQDASDSYVLASYPSLGRISNLTYSLEWLNPSTGIYESLTSLADDFADSVLDLRPSIVRGYDEMLLGGAPFYDGAPALQQASPVSPAARTYELRLTGTDAGGLGTSTDFEIDVVIGGCMSPSAAWDAVTNPNGNYNPDATVATGECVFPAQDISGTSGGTIQILSSDGSTDGEGAVTITFPAGALSATTTITVSGASSLQTQGKVSGLNPAQKRPRKVSVLADKMLHLEPEGIVFAVPITITMILGPLPSGTTAIGLVASRSSTTDPYGYFESLSNCTLETSSGRLSCKLTHFSIVAPATVPTSNVLSIANADTRARRSGCPFDCHGNGQCDATSRCVCYSGFEGASCDRRSCPFGPTWGDPHSSELRASFPGPTLTECSSKGRCDYSTGRCQCFDGFEGAACQRMGCAVDPAAAHEIVHELVRTTPNSPSAIPTGREAYSASGRDRVAQQRRTDLRRLAESIRSSSKSSTPSPNPTIVPSTSAAAASSSFAPKSALQPSKLRPPRAASCSGHGQCLPIQALSSQRRDSTLFREATFTDTYSGWDEARIMACECDPGFTGPDCSLRTCPLGDDPLSSCDRSDPSGPPCDPDAAAEVWEVALSLPTTPSAATDVPGDLVLDYSDGRGVGRRSPRLIDPTGAGAALWSLSGSSSATSLQTALESAVGASLVVSSEERTSRSRRWYVTFTGKPGTQNVLRCPSNMACDTPGCAPRFQQLTYSSTAPTTGNPLHARLSPGRIFRPPTQSAGHSTSSFDIRVDVTVSYITIPSTGESRAVMSITAQSPSSGGTILVSRSNEPIPFGRSPYVPSDDSTDEIRSKDSLFTTSTTIQGARGIAIGAGNLAIDFLVDNPDPGNYVWLVSSATCSTQRIRTAHPRFEAAECSGRGKCNRKTGECDCLQGFASYNCGVHVLDL